MANSLRDSVRAIMADILEIDIESISDYSSMQSIEQWDSGNHVKLVLALEEEFDVMFEIAEIEAMVRFKDLLSTLENKL